MHIQHWPDAASFLAHTRQFLEANEATHNLLLGISAELIQNPHQFGAQPAYFATVESGDPSNQILLAALRTPPHPLSLSLATACNDAGLDLLVADVLTEYPDLTGATGPLESAARFAQRWSAQTGATYQTKLALRIYQLTEVQAPANVPGKLRQATQTDQALIIDWIKRFHEDAGDEPFDDDTARAATQRWLTSSSRTLCLWEIDGQPVAMAGAGGPTPHGIRISAVYTPRALRGRGYASACVAALSQLQLDSGRDFCFLFTDLANLTSNSIYQKIGYQPVCDASEIGFER
jgi:predicted GNAT family acetyltransferase